MLQGVELEFIKSYIDEISSNEDALECEKELIDIICAEFGL